MKVEIFFRNILKDNRHVNGFQEWFEVKKTNINKSYEELKIEEEY